MMKEDLVSIYKDKSGITPGNGRLRPNQQVRIQLPLVHSSTQTEDKYVYSPISIPEGSMPIIVPPNVVSTTTFNDTQPLINYGKMATPSSSSHTPTPVGRDSVIKDRDMVDTSDGICIDSNNYHDIPPPAFKTSEARHKQKSEISSYVLALRPWSFPASITPVALGSCLAYQSQGVFDISIFLTTVITALCVHAAGNLVNTYFDFVRGIDTKKSDDRTIVDNILSLNDVATLGGVFYIAGCVGFMILNFLSPAKMEHLALIYFCGLSSSFLYTGGLGLKYVAMGDILIVLTFGPLTVVFSHLSQTGHLSLTPLIYAIPLALNTEAILHCNNARDMDIDKQAGIITLAILLGKTGSYLLFCFLLFLPYLIFITIGVHYSRYMLLPAASIIFAFRLEKQFRRRELDHMPQKVAQLNLLLGVLYITSILISNSSLLPIMTFL